MIENRVSNDFLGSANRAALGSSSIGVDGLSQNFDKKLKGNRGDSIGDGFDAALVMQAQSTLPPIYMNNALQSNVDLTRAQQKGGSEDLGALKEEPLLRSNETLVGGLSNRSLPLTTGSELSPLLGAGGSKSGSAIPATFGLQSQVGQVAELESKKVDESFNLAGLLGAAVKSKGKEGERTSSLKQQPDLSQSLQPQTSLIDKRGQGDFDRALNRDTKVLDSIAGLPLTARGIESPDLFKSGDFMKALSNSNSTALESKLNSSEGLDSELLSGVAYDLPEKANSLVAKDGGVMGGQTFAALKGGLQSEREVPRQLASLPKIAKPLVGTELGDAQAGIARLRASSVSTEALNSSELKGSSRFPEFSTEANKDVDKDASSFGELEFGVSPSETMALRAGGGTTFRGASKANTPSKQAMASGATGSFGSGSLKEQQDDSIRSGRKGVRSGGAEAEPSVGSQTQQALTTERQSNVQTKTLELSGLVTQGAGTRDRLSSDSLQQLGQHITQWAATTGGANGSASGGEIRMRLKPEHLGEVHLKITANGADVGIQIRASDDKAKKILEESIQGLRDSLSQNNLSLTKFDISTAQSAGTGFGSNSDLGGSNAQSQGSQFAQMGSSMQEGSGGNLNGSSQRQQHSDDRSQASTGRVPARGLSAATGSPYARRSVAVDSGRIDVTA